MRSPFARSGGKMGWRTEIEFRLVIPTPRMSAARARDQVGTHARINLLSLRFNCTRTPGEMSTGSRPNPSRTQSVREAPG